MKKLMLLTTLMLSLSVFAQDVKLLSPKCDTIDGINIFDTIPLGFTGNIINCYQGHLLSLSSVQDGTPTGNSRSWDLQTGEITVESIVENNLIYKRQWNYTQNKVRYLYEEEVFSIEEKKHGTQKQWFENGQLEKELNYANGKPNGTMKRWYKNGQLAMEANYVDGQLISENCYDENGKKRKCR